MKVSERTLKWIMRFYPPLFFQRIWVKRFLPDFLGVEVTIKNSVLNRNYNSSIFGGSIYTAADPFYPILLERIFKQKGFEVRVWLKSASIQYLKPARTDLHFTIQIADNAIANAEEALIEKGKFVASFLLNMYDDNKEHCVCVENEVYIRNLNYAREQRVLPS